MFVWELKAVSASDRPDYGKVLKWSQKGASSMTERIIYLEVNSIPELSLSRTTPFFTSQRHFHSLSFRHSVFVPLKRVIWKGLWFPKQPKAFKQRIKRAVICSASLSIAVYVLCLWLPCMLDAFNFYGRVKIHRCNLLLGKNADTEKSCP